VNAIRGALKRPLVACGVLLLVYVAVSFLNDPHGFLGTDTGGKVATLRMMARHHTLDPNLGYWAQRWDPSGRLHPLYYTSHLNGRWVNVTTLPALIVALPLWMLGGYRLALLVPMMGAVLAALAARSLARRLGAGNGNAAFWIVGLASPLVIYALDLWEHSLGVAIVAWGVVVLIDAVEAADWRRGLLAGGLFGLAATMRTEALVYGGVATAVACLLLVRRTLRGAVLLGATAALGLVILLAANNGLERAAIGTTLRSERVSGTASAGGSGVKIRSEEAVLTATGLEPELSGQTYVIGIVLLGLLLLAASGRQGTATLAGAGALILYAIRAADGLGFIPGLVATTPIVVAAAFFRRSTSGAARKMMLGTALVALPLVWVFQYSGGAAPQWAGRYILPSGLLLLVAGVLALPEIRKPIRVGFIALSVAVTGFGVAWLAQRSHDTARMERALGRRPEPVLVSRIAHLAREGGAFYGTVDDRRWLTAVTASDVQLASTVLDQAGVDRFAMIDLPEDGAPAARIGQFSASPSSDRVPWLDGVVLRVTSYSRGSGR
jgi:hypothetical protein